MSILRVEIGVFVTYELFRKYGVDLIIPKQFVILI